ncbi:pentapeptide repeat-containing protein [Psychromarinibacter sp. C21-152]|uniref:Pentapeptide repeat-containing protein n=1 Tax=Psychromarinibacter sediminicola TaxID=3033385 RepID=A0AAE3TBV1_9RHOB|nr:pentapeptide repeat-containing protein [Psychromarinibacter sediminicola]MDF0602995.1 pentapeptide repeat-containing protein [Psychromarinibacter sediminicola]
MTTFHIQSLLHQHVLWLESRGQKGSQLTLFDADFRGAELNGLNLSDAIIPGANFSGMVLEDIDFYGSNLASANFSNATLKNVQFIKSNLDYAVLTNTKVIGGSWFRATCIDAQVAGLTFSGTNLERTFPQLS